MAATPRLSGRASIEARRLVRAQVRIVDGRVRTWCAHPLDRDALHGARTSLRRLRVIVRSLRPDLGSLAKKRLRRDMRSAFRSTSGIRDRDVFAAWLITLPSSRASRHLLDDAEQRARSRAAAAAGRLGAAWRAIHRRLMVPKREWVEPARSRSFGRAVAHAIREELNEVDRGLDAVDGPHTAAMIHAVRIAAKRLRYLLEAVAGQSPDARRPVEWCRAFQDLVGDARDAMLAARRARTCPRLQGRARLIAALVDRRRRTRAELSRFVADRGAWETARRDALTICHRYVVLGAGSPHQADRSR